MITETEKSFWAKSESLSTPKSTDQEINDKYLEGEQRIVTETNKEKLPNFVKALDKPGYMELRPFYQRRARWDRDRQSKLIESFIMNVPVPPIFLFEKEFNKYEVMDGQQRITAIKSFYDNELKLKGLENWPELNGKTYSTLPSMIKAGIDRRSISSIVLLKESTKDIESAMLLRQTVFERLNTGGVKLERQEIRNSICPGPFNELLIELSKSDIFRKAWEIPLYTPEEDRPEGSLKQEIFKDSRYSKMKDVEIVLRFFALRHASEYRNGMQGFLDIYMIKANNFNDDDIDVLRHLFMDTIQTAHEIFDDIIFCPYDAYEAEWKASAQVAFYDCVMVSLSRQLNNKHTLIKKKSDIIAATKSLFMENDEGTFTGRGNTKADVTNRINLFEEMIKSFC